MSQQKIMELYQPTPAGPDYDNIGTRQASGVMVDQRGMMRYGKGAQDAFMTRRLFEDYRLAQRPWAWQAQADYAFSQGAQWDRKDVDKLNEMGQKVAVRNVIHRALDQITSILTARKPAFRATAREDSDLRRAYIRSALLTWIWDQSQGQGLNSARDIYTYKAMGRAVMGVYVDPDMDMGKGEVLIESHDPIDVYPDPATQNPLWDDAGHIIVRRYLSAGQIKKRWPQVDVTRMAYDDNQEEDREYQQNLYRDKGQRLNIDEVDRQYDRMYNVLERYTKVKRLFFRLIDPMDPNGEELLSEMEMQKRVQDVAFVVETMNATQVVKDDVGVQHFEQIFQEMGGIMGPGSEEITVEYHLVQMPGIAGPDGQVGLAEPEMVQGPPISEYAIPESHTKLTRTFIKNILETGLLTYRKFMYDRVRVCGSVGSQDLYPAYDLPTCHYPIVPIQKSVTYTAYPISDVSLVRDAQERINKSLSLLLAYQANATNLKVVFPQDAIRNRERWEQEMTRPGTAFLDYERSGFGGDGKDIQFVHPAPMPAEVIGQIEMETHYINELMGAYPMSQGDPSDAPDTYRGTLQIDEYANRRIMAQMNDIYRAYSRAGQVALDLATDVYEPTKVIRIVNPNGDTEEMALQDWGYEISQIGNRIQNIYDVVVVAGSTLPSNRWALVDMYLELYQAGIVDIEAVLMKSELPDAHEIIERVSEYRRAMQALQEAQAMIEKYRKDIDTMEGELRHADRQVATQKFIAELHALSARITKMVESEEERKKMIEQHAKQLAQAKAMASVKKNT